MLDYATPFSRAGGAAGAGALGGLGRALEPLDYPRQALWNLPGKLAEGDFLGALPGLLGAGGAGALALSGVGLPLALLGGSALGGLSQGVGHLSGDERFQAPSGSALAEALGLDPESLPGMGVGMAAQIAGDPLTYAGGLGGARAGAKYGNYLEDVARTRGPNYPGGVEKVQAMMGGGDNEFARRLEHLIQSPELPRVLGEVPPGSTALGSGAEALAFKTPEGGVVRLGGGPDAISVARKFQESPLAPPPRVNAPEVMQSARDIPVGQYRVEHTPLMEMLPSDVGQMDPRWAHLEEAQGPLGKAIIDRGYATPDLHLGNLGMTPQGKYLAVDPGSVLPGPGGTFPPERVNQRGGDAVSNLLLRLLGSDRAVQREISAGVSPRALEGVGLEVPAARAMREAALARRQALAQEYTWMPSNPGSGVDPLLAGLSTDRRVGGR